VKVKKKSEVQGVAFFTLFYFIFFSTCTAPYTGTGKRKVERILQSKKNNIKLIGDRMVVSSNE
jgi:hypothetical protein